MEVVKLTPMEKSKFHFGYLNLEINDITFHSDSLFSAICNNYIRKYGNEKIDEFISSFPKISSLFYGIEKEGKELFFIPKPVKFNLPKNLREEDRKLTKKVKFISLKAYQAYFKEDWNARKDIICNDDKDCLYLEDEWENGEDKKEKLRLFTNAEDEKVAINRLTSVSEDGMLYNVSSVIPEQNVFFYFIVDGNASEEFNESVRLIESFGIGGELSTGYGQIKEISRETKQLPELGFNANANCKTSLSVVFPKRDELDQDSILAYRLIERKGFIYNSSIRRKPLLGLAEGSVFKNGVEGAVVDVSPDKSMPAKKFGKAFLIHFKVDENEA